MVTPGLVRRDYQPAVHSRLIDATNNGGVRTTSLSESVPGRSSAYRSAAQLQESDVLQMAAALQAWDLAWSDPMLVAQLCKDLTAFGVLLGRLRVLQAQQRQGGSSPGRI